jgi:hypothetical protein
MITMEQRAYVRRLLDAEGTMANALGNAWSQIRILDISRMGIAFATDELLIVNTSRAMSLRLPDSSEPIKFIAKIVNRSPRTDIGFRVGANFVKIDANDIALIEQYVNAA